MPVSRKRNTAFQPVTRRVSLSFSVFVYYIGKRNGGGDVSAMVATVTRNVLCRSINLSLSNDVKREMVSP